jgi:hypothetical protein
MARSERQNGLLETLWREAGRLDNACSRDLDPGKVGQVRPGPFKSAEQLDIGFRGQVRQI